MHENHTYHKLLELGRLSDIGELRNLTRSVEGDPAVVRVAKRKAEELLRLRLLERRAERRAQAIARARRVRAMLEAEGTLYVLHSFVDCDGGGADRLRTFDSHDEFFEWRREMRSEPLLRQSITIVDRETAENFHPRTVDYGMRAHEDGHPHVLYI